MSDPFDPVSVHGVWPLVADPGEPGGIRFADMGRDAPTDCMTSPDGLPEAAVEIRLFAGQEIRDAWCAAVAEFGGNAVAARGLAEADIPAALLVRFDVPPLPGSTLEERVALVGPRPRGLAQSRGATRRARTERARDTAWRMAWAGELAAMEGRDDLRLDTLHSPSTLERLVLDIRGARLASAIWIKPAESGRRIVLRMGHKGPFDLRHPDLDARMRAAVADLGYDVGEGGDPGKVVASVDAGVLDAAMADLAAMERTRSDLLATAVRRGRLADAIGERQGRILRRLAAGFPIAKAKASSTYAYQVNPDSGHGVDIDGWALERLWECGAIRPAWWSGRNPGKPRRDQPFDAFVSSVWVATDLGLRLARPGPDIDAAADRLPAVLDAAWAIVSGDAASPAFSALGDVVPDAPWTPPPDAPQPRTAKGKGPAPLPKRAKDLAELAARTVHGAAPGIRSAA